MLLYIIRHAEAEERAVTGRDADRALTAAGREAMRRGAKGLRRLGVELDGILSSPYRRAAETAEIVARALGDVEIEEVAALAAGGDASGPLGALARRRSTKRLGLVGHQPDLGLLASQLLTGSVDLAPLHFRKGAVACLDVELTAHGLRGNLEWFLTLKQLGAVGG